MRSQAALVKRHFELVQEELGLSAADVEAERAKAAAADKRPPAGSFSLDRQRISRPQAGGGRAHGRAASADADRNEVQCGDEIQSLMLWGLPRMSHLVSVCMGMH